MKKVSRSLVGSLLAGLSMLTWASTARAEQFVLLDVTFTFTKADADNATPSKSHYYVKSDRLNAAAALDWTKPIDYRNGKVHVRTEVMDKPAGSAETQWTLRATTTNYFSRRANRLRPESCVIVVRWVFPGQAGCCEHPTITRSL